MSNQYVHARNHQSKSLTTILGLPRNVILPAIHDFPGGPMTGDKLRRYMILQFVTQGVPRPAAAVCLGYPTNFIAVMENCPVPVGIVNDVITNAGSTILDARDGVPLEHFPRIQHDFSRISENYAASAAQDGSTNAAPGAHEASDHEASDTDESDSTKSSHGSKGSKASARTRAKAKPAEPIRVNTGGGGGAEVADDSGVSAAPASSSEPTVAPRISTRHTFQATTFNILTNMTPREAANGAASLDPDFFRIAKAVQDHNSVAIQLGLNTLGKFKDPRIGAVLNEHKRMTLETQMAHESELEKLAGTFNVLRYILERIDIIALLGGRSEAAVAHELREYLLKHTHPDAFSAVNPIFLFNALFKEAIVELLKYSGGMSESAIIELYVEEKRQN